MMAAVSTSETLAGTSQKIDTFMLAAVRILNVTTPQLRYKMVIQVLFYYLHSFATNTVFFGESVVMQKLSVYCLQNKCQLVSVDSLLLCVCVSCRLCKMSSDILASA